MHGMCKYRLSNTVLTKYRLCIIYYAISISPRLKIEHSNVLVSTLLYLINILECLLFSPL